MRHHVRDPLTRLRRVTPVRARTRHGHLRVRRRGARILHARCATYLREDEEVLQGDAARAHLVALLQHVALHERQVLHGEYRGVSTAE